MVWYMIDKVHDRNAKVGMKIHIHEYIIKFEKGSSFVFFLNCQSFFKMPIVRQSVNWKTFEIDLSASSKQKFSSKTQIWFWV